MDTDGIPITYGLHPGSMLDKQTFIPMLREIQKNFDLGRTIVVADKGMTTGDNTWYTLSAKNGYILSYSIRGTNRKFKEYGLNQNGYRSIGENFKIKSRLEPREITVTSKSGKKAKKQVDKNKLFFTAGSTPKKQRRTGQLPCNKATTYGAAKYVKNLAYDKKTGEILKTVKRHCFLMKKSCEKRKNWMITTPL